MRTTLAVAAALAFSAPVAAQDPPKGDFDYLVGDWEYSADSKEFGHFTGRWSAVKLPEGQILDEWRVLDETGETVYMTTTIRAYSVQAQRWELIGMDAGGGLQDFGTAQKVGDEIHIEQRFGVATDQPAIMRIRYYDITPDGFSWRADRSTDDGKTWVRDHLVMTAKRVGPARAITVVPAPAS